MDHEYAGNLHAHTPYSDGHASHEAVARAAMEAGLDFVVTTDHNVWVQGVEGYYQAGARRVLLLTGEEVHDASREPQKNHLLVYGAGQELAPFASQPQRLLDAVRRRGGLSFLAHPVDPSAALFSEPDLSWVDWDVRGFNGLEIWNFMSEFKARLTTWPRALWASLFPAWSPRGPSPEVLRRWDEALAAGRRLVAIGGADAHGTPFGWGPIRRVVFPYPFLFRTVNTHVICDEPWSGEAEADARRLYDTLRAGSCFVGYDLSAPTRGFRFRAVDDRGTVPMGGTATARFGVTFQIRTPRPAEIRMIRDGHLVRRWPEEESAVLTAHEPGAYRVEVLRADRGRKRGWIYSNPIYLTKPRGPSARR